VLVIVKSLEGKGEIFRSLTDSTGTVPERDLARGLYRIIATCPYGICQTKVSEFLVGTRPVELGLSLDVWPTRGNGPTIGPSDRITIQVIDAQGRAVPSAEILVRDSEAQNERWYTTNAGGEAEVELPKGAVTIAMLYSGSLSEEIVSRTSIEKLKAEGKKLSIRFELQR
jgi:hypothetical protein